MTDKPINVLVVDDEKELVSHLVKRLRQREINAVGVNSGDAAIEAARQQGFDVAVVDVKMPGIDGVETLKELRSLQSRLQVIMLTGYGSVENAFQAGKLDAYGFFSKPYAFDGLLRKIQQAARERRTALRLGYQKELDGVLSGNLTPRDIMEETERIRKKYEQ